MAPGIWGIDLKKPRRRYRSFEATCLQDSGYLSRYAGRLMIAIMKNKAAMALDKKTITIFSSLFISWFL